MDIEKTMEFLLGQQARFDAPMFQLADRAAEIEERHDREMAEIRSALSRAVRAGIEEQRRERVRRNELDGKITQLAAAQVVTEEKLQKLLDGLSKKNGTG